MEILVAIFVMGPVVNTVPPAKSTVSTEVEAKLRPASTLLVLMLIECEKGSRRTSARCITTKREKELHARRRLAVAQVTSVLYDAQRFAHFRQGVRGAPQMLALVRGADNGAQPRFAFRHRGIANGWSKNAGIEKLA